MTIDKTTRGFAMSGLKNGWKGALGILAAVALIAGCSGGEDANVEAAPVAEERPVMLSRADVATAELADLTAGVVITGSLRPAYQASIRSQVGGTVTQVAVDRGTAVTQGQVLAVIDAAGVRAQATAAEAALALARQRLESARILREAGAISALDYQAAEAAYEAAAAQAEGAKEMAQRATVRAPIAGVIGERTVEEGEAIGMNDPLFTVVRSDVLELAGAVPVDAVVRIRPGQSVVFTLSAFPGREFRGTVARIEPVADPSTRQVGVYLRLPNPGGVIGGQFATGRVLGETTAQTIAVPETAIRGAAADSHVLVLESGRAVKKPVTLGGADPARGLVGIASGLEPGAQVIITPGATIAEGTRVEVTAPAANGQEG